MFAQQLQALNIHVDEDTIEENGIMVRPNTNKNIETITAIQADAEAIVQALEVISSLIQIFSNIYFFYISFL